MYEIHLTNGTTLRGDDERDTIDLVAHIAEDATRPSDDDGMPEGWTWAAGHYLVARSVIGVSYVAEAGQ